MEPSEANQLGREAMERDDLEAALDYFDRAIEAAPDWSVAHYNKGLVLKFQKNWGASLEANWKAHQLNPDDDAAFWNLAIAAVAVGDWQRAGIAFRAIGLPVPEDQPGPWDFQLGLIPIRLNPDREQAEVVWCHRLDPVRAQISNVPLPDSLRRFGDIVLNDGEPRGHRKLGQQEVPVFDELTRLAESDYDTFEAEVELEDQEAVADLTAFLSEHGQECEDWSDSIRQLCRACSEGRPHQGHDQELESAAWSTTRRLGLASPNQRELEQLLHHWPRARVLKFRRVFPPLPRG